MSYSILYNAVFLKSERGITPVILHGDNNVYDTDGNGRATRRSRDWSCFDNRLADSEENLIAKCEKFSEDAEIWRVRGRIVNGLALTRWMKTGIKNALTVEQVLALNELSSIYCYVWGWDKTGYAGRRCNQWVSTTEQFDAWIDEAKAYVANRKEDEGLFFVVRFGKEGIRTRKPAEDGKYVVEITVKNGTIMYVKKVDADKINLDTNLNKAHHYSRMATAQAMVNKYQNALQARGCSVRIIKL